MSHFRTIWLTSWFAVAAVVFAMGVGSDSRQTTDVPVTSTALEQSSPAAKKIEEIRVGNRVMGEWSAGELQGETAVDPTNWRKYTLYAELAWPDGTIDDVHVETLQPSQWADLTDARKGRQVPIPLDLVEMGLPEDLTAEVVAVEPCPTIEAGPGRVVLTTVNHLNSYLFNLSFVSSAGETESVRTTGWHKFYRQDDNAWVSAVELATGDTLEGVDGPLTVGSLVRVPGTHRVYNMTVEGEHVYRVAGLGVLVHNEDCKTVLTKIKDLKPLDTPAHTAPRPALQNLSDDELLRAARSPKKGDTLVRNTRTGKLHDGNGRAIELQKRAADLNSSISPDDLVPVEDYTPNLEMFPDSD